MEALVFDENVETFVDETLPDVEMQEEKIKAYVDVIKEEFGSDPAGTAKRSNTSAAGDNNPSKSAKMELSMGAIERAVIDGRANSCTVRNLKDFLQVKGKFYPSGAVKKNLVELAESIVNMN